MNTISVINTTGTIRSRTQFQRDTKTVFISVVPGKFAQVLEAVSRSRKARMWRLRLAAKTLLCDDTIALQAVQRCEAKTLVYHNKIAFPAVQHCYQSKTAQLILTMVFLGTRDPQVVQRCCY